jgi:hypothetical protein
MTDDDFRGAALFMVAVIVLLGFPERLRRRQRPSFP